LAQITHSVAPDLLFQDYPYFSSVSDATVDHARQLVEQLASLLKLGPRSLIVEIASNDGYLLQHYVSRGIPVLGIDPARNIAGAAAARGVPTIIDFFDRRLAERLKDAGQLADVVHANNVLAHTPALHDVLGGIGTILKPDGVAVVETPYVRDLVDRLEFDTIYHEHVFYYSLSSLQRQLGRHGLAVIDVERIDIHGGSLRLTLAHEDAFPATPAAPALIAEEAAIGLTNVDYFRGFAEHVASVGRELRTTLADLREAGNSIAAYGAAAKGAVLLNAFGIGRETIDFVADRSPHKEGRFMPGVRIPIHGVGRLLDGQPDLCLLLAWNFADEILEQQAEFRRRGGRFIIPLPTPILV
jgi:SAM-dependent methyltransferase